MQHVGAERPRDTTEFVLLRFAHTRGSGDALQRPEAWSERSSNEEPKAVRGTPPWRTCAPT